MPGAKRPEKAVDDPQRRSKRQSAGHAVCRDCRSHRKSLRQPLCRGSS